MPGQNIEYLVGRNNNTPEDAISLAILRLRLSNVEPNFLDAANWSTTCFYPLLEKVDSCRETIGKVTCIPMKVLARDVTDEVRNKAYFMMADGVPLVEIKRYMFENSNYYSYSPHEYKPHTLNQYFKPYMRSSLTKHPRHHERYHDRLRSRYAVTAEAVNAARDEWLSDKNISEFCKKLPYIFDNCCFVWPMRSYHNHIPSMLVVMPENSKNVKRIGSDMAKLRNELCNVKGRYVYLPVIYDEHFTVFLYDNNLQTLYYFNSVGCRDPPVISGVKTFLLRNNGSLEHVAEGSEEDIFIRAVTTEFRDKMNCKKLVVNDFMIQESFSECGMFVIMFCLLNCSMPPEDVAHYSRNVAMFEHMGDYTVGILRSLFFVTSEDTDYDQYIRDFATKPIKNSKFLLYQKDLKASEEALKRTLLKERTE